MQILVQTKVGRPLFRSDLGAEFISFLPLFQHGRPSTLTGGGFAGYTPHDISIRAGTSYHDLQEIKQLELSEPDGWVRISLEVASGRPLRANMLQLAILSNHQNGRDTHLRLLEVFTSLACVQLFFRVHLPPHTHSLR